MLKKATQNSGNKN